MGWILFFAAGILVLPVFLGALKAIISLRPLRLQPLGQNTRDAYFIVGMVAAGCFVLGLLKTGRLSSFEIAGIKGDLQRIDRMATTTAFQVEELFKAKRRETFDASNWQQLRVVRALPNQGSFELEVTLQQAPIPNSVEIFRGSLATPPDNITSVEGNMVRFLTYSKTYDANPIVVQYFARVGRVSF